MQEITAAPWRPIARAISLAYHSLDTSERKKAKGKTAGMVTSVYTILQWLKKLPQKVLIQEVWTKYSLKTKQKTRGTALTSPTYKTSTSMHACRNTLTCNTVHVFFHISLYTYLDKRLHYTLCKLQSSNEISMMIWHVKVVWHTLHTETHKPYQTLFIRLLKQLNICLQIWIYRRDSSIHCCVSA